MHKLWTLILLIGMGLITACDRQAPTPSAEQPPVADSPTLAEVNGAAISQIMLDAYMQARGIATPTPEQQEAALNDLINLVLLQQQAEKTGLTDDPQLQAALRLERVNSMASAMARQYTSEHPVTEAQAKARYQSGLEQAGVTEYQLRHILLPSKEQALQVVAQLDQGADFAQLAEEKSIDKRVGAGGSLGWLNTAQLPPPLAEIVKSTPVGSYSQEPVQTPYGWHIVKVEDTREFTPPSFDQVKSGVIASMQREQMQQYLTSLRAGAEINIQANFAAPAPMPPAGAQSDDQDSPP